MKVMMETIKGKNGRATVTATAHPSQRFEFELDASVQQSDL